MFRQALRLLVERAMEQVDTMLAAGGERATPAVHGALRREGSYWTIDYGGTVCRLRDTTGLRYLAHLLARPGRKVAATELLRAGRRRWEKRLRNRAHAESVAAAAAETQRARVRVTRAIRTALARIAAHDAPLGEYLRATIRTGAYCSYAPDNG